MTQSPNPIYMLTEVAIPGLEDFGINQTGYTQEEICPKCGKSKRKCICKDKK